MIIKAMKLLLLRLHYGYFCNPPDQFRGRSKCIKQSSARTAVYRSMIAGYRYNASNRCLQDNCVILHPADFFPEALSFRVVPGQILDPQSLSTVNHRPYHLTCAQELLAFDASRFLKSGCARHGIACISLSNHSWVCRCAWVGV